MRCSWSGARLHHSLAAVGARRLLSTPSHEAFDSGLGSALARTLARSGRSPNLTGFTFGVSSGGLKLLQVPCVYQFHHSGWLDSLPSPFSPDYRRACSNCTARLAPSWLLAVQETNTGCIPEGMETCAIPSFAGHSLTKKRLDKGGFKSDASTSFAIRAGRQARRLAPKPADRPAASTRIQMIACRDRAPTHGRGVLPWVVTRLPQLADVDAAVHTCPRNLHNHMIYKFFLKI